MDRVQHNSLPALYWPAHIRLQGQDAYPLHDHDFGEVFWVEKGSFKHFVNGSEIPVNKGDLVFIRPSDRHSFHGCGEKPFFIMNIAFSWSIYLALRERYFPELLPLYGEDASLPKQISLSAAQLTQASNSFLELLNAKRSSFQIERFLMNLFAEFCPIPADEFLSNAPLWMQNAWINIQQPDRLALGVSEFCRLCGRSPEHVSREFHRLTGQTLMEKISRLRMERAASLLEGTSQEIADIALTCGYQSLSHFYAIFSRSYGLSPSAFRKRAQRSMYPT